MNFIRLLVMFLMSLVVAFLLHYLLYGVGREVYRFTLINISDTTLLMSIMLLVPVVLMLSKSYLVFQAMVYTTRIMVNHKYKEKYPTLKEYQDDKSSDMSTTFFYELGLIGLIYILTSITLGVMFIS